jgi:hypothetical protein
MEVSQFLATIALRPRKNLGFHRTGGQEPVWTLWRREKSVVPTGVRTPDRPARAAVAVPTHCNETYKTKSLHTNLFTAQNDKICSARNTEIVREDKRYYDDNERNVREELLVGFLSHTKQKHRANGNVF